MREAYMNSYMMQYHSYVSLVNRCRRSIGGHVRAAAEEGAPDIPTFGGFGDKEGFNGAWPSDQYLRAVWHKWFYDTVVIEADGVRMTREDYLQRVGQLVDGMVLAGDASFKYAKVIRLTSAGESTKSKPIQGIFTILNEYEQVVFQKAMKTSSVHDLKSDLKNIFVNRYVGHGFKLPVILFSDECCEDREMFLAMFREIEEVTGVRLFDATGEEAAEGGAELAALTFPEGKTGVRVFDKTAIDIAVANLVGGCATQGMVLGMDCEWEPAFNGSSERPVCTLQLALPDGTSSLFHLQRGGRGITPSTFNTNLKRLLGDLAITKVGVAVKGDGKRLQRDYDVETRGMVDLRSYARACWVDLPCRSLAGMTATALGKYLSKDAAGRFSHWSRPELTPNQIEYACLDAYAAVLLHAEIGKFKDPIFGEAPSEVPAAGTKVHLCQAARRTPMLTKTISSTRQDQHRLSTRTVVMLRAILKPIARVTTTPSVRAGQVLIWRAVKQAVEDPALAGRALMLLWRHRKKLAICSLCDSTCSMPSTACHARSRKATAPSGRSWRGCVTPVFLSTGTTSYR